MIAATSARGIETTTGLCGACGIPLDSLYFDDSRVVALPATTRIGEEIVLARFELPAQYCGVLQYFSQFTDAFGREPANIQTPSIEWRLLVNNQAMFPYINLRHIVNPWGYGSYPVNIRLSEDSTIELSARIVASIQTDPAITAVAGRIMGRFWYNTSYGDRR